MSESEERDAAKADAAAWRACCERLVEAALLFRRSACRPADDGKYDDLYDTARDSLIDAIAEYRRLAGKETGT